MSEKSKYENKNPIHQFLLKRFLSSATSAIEKTGSQKIVEIGCADGYVYSFLKKHLQKDFDYHGYDIDTQSLSIARQYFPEASFEEGDVYTIKPHAEIIVCMEVFEHLEKPVEAVQNLASAQSNYFLVSVPREPFFRLGNLVRGRNVKTFGNLPDHINHWNKRSFKRFLEPYFNLVGDYSSFPWVVYLLERK